MVSGKHAGRPEREKADSANQSVDPKTKKLLAKTKSSKFGIFVLIVIVVSDHILRVFPTFLNDILKDS